jgi:lipoate-protein ligase A
MHRWYLLDSGPCDSAFNMALDEVLLEAMPRLRRPVLRFYGWTQPAASFGYFQKFAEIERLTGLRPLVRRPTGGGLVPHQADWTYSLVFPLDSEWYSLAAVESYRRAHEWLRMGFSLLGIATQLATEARKVQAGQCFVGCERSDLLFQGRKIAGAAQRRRRDGLLVQGSVQPPPQAPARADWQQAMCKAGASASGTEWQELKLEQPLINRATILAQQKYSQASYNQRR